ncbi:MAG: hypothetical protein ACW97A_10570 [Candidatus Thorarchaeota archaeon]|jgi:hypothetical protein
MLRQSRAPFALLAILILPIGISFPVVEASTAESRPMDSPQRVYGMDVSRSVFSRVSFNSFQNLIIELTLDLQGVRVQSSPRIGLRISL